MKTIEQAASDFSKTRNNEKEIQFILDVEAFKRGVEFAQRWILPSEDLPEHRTVVLAHVPMINYPFIFCYDQIKSKWFHLYDGEFYESEITPTNWRPIERK